MGTTDTKIFDRETLLDLTVNFVPLGILLFFTVYILAIDPWNMATDPLIMVVTLGLHIVPFVALAALTYLSGKAIAGSEKEGEVYLAGRASVTTAQPLEAEHHDHGDETDHTEVGEPDAAAVAAAEGDTDDADDPEGEAETAEGARAMGGTADVDETRDATDSATENADPSENESDR